MSCHGLGPDSAELEGVVLRLTARLTARSPVVRNSHAPVNEEIVLRITSICRCKLYLHGFSFERS